MLPKAAFFPLLTQWKTANFSSATRKPENTSSGSKRISSAAPTKTAPSLSTTSVPRWTASARSAARSATSAFWTGDVSPISMSASRKSTRKMRSITLRACVFRHTAPPWARRFSSTTRWRSFVTFIPARSSAIRRTPSAPSTFSTPSFCFIGRRASHTKRRRPATRYSALRSRSATARASSPRSASPCRSRR